jgi:Acetyl esterase (deacetylase)
MTALTRDQLCRLTGCDGGLSGRWRAGQDWRIGPVTACDGWIDSEAAPVPARLLWPDTPNGAAILYAHAHGNRYDIGKAELTEGRPALQDPPLGLYLAGLGYTVLCRDIPGFGARQGEGSESALSKAALWYGRPLLGLMLDDLARAQEALAGLSGVDGGRIAVLGVSMGATLAYWHAALTPSVAACAHLCAFARMAPLIATGAHDLHGPYMTVPGLLPAHDMDDVAALIAPRPQLVGAGLQIR